MKVIMYKDKPIKSFTAHEVLPDDIDWNGGIIIEVEDGWDDERYGDKLYWWISSDEYVLDCRVTRAMYGMEDE